MLEQTVGTDMAMAMAVTKNIINPRVEIDTSPPFESVKEAVNLFGGSGPWIPHQMLPLDAANHQDTGGFDIDKMEEHTAQLERLLITRERETLNVLRELEEAKKLVEGFKVHLLREGSNAFMSSPPNVKPESHFSAPTPEKSAAMLSFSPAPPPLLNLMELDQARVNLNRTTIDLAVIRASVESLNKKMRNERGLLERSSEAKIDPNSSVVFCTHEEDHKTSRANLERERKELETESGPNSISAEQLQFKFEAEQYKKMVEASRYEVTKAMSEIERTKASIKMAEMRLNAARKIEEAAKAVEAIAFVEGKSLLSDDQTLSSEAHMRKPEEITLPFEEYNVLSYKAKQADEMCKTKLVDANGMPQSNRPNRHTEAGLNKDMNKTTKETYKKNSLEAAFHDEGGFHRREFIEDGDSTDYHKMRYSGYSSTVTPNFRDSHPSVDRKDSCLLNTNEPKAVKDKSVPVYRSTISIGDVLSRKLILHDDVVVEQHVEAQAARQQVSLSQMLRQQSGLILQHTNSTKDGSTDRHYFSQKKKFGFIHVVLPKHKKKAQVLNM